MNSNNKTNRLYIASMQEFNEAEIKTINTMFKHMPILKSVNVLEAWDGFLIKVEFTEEIERELYAQMRHDIEWHGYITCNSIQEYIQSLRRI